MIQSPPSTSLMFMGPECQIIYSQDIHSWEKQLSLIHSSLKPFYPSAKRLSIIILITINRKILEQGTKDVNKTALYQFSHVLKLTKQRAFYHLTKEGNRRVSPDLSSLDIISICLVPPAPESESLTCEAHKLFTMAAKTQES